MKECILLFNFEQARARKLVAQLMMLKFKVKIVKEEEWNYTVGYLCGKEEQCKEDCPPERKEQVLLDSPMLVMAGVDEKRMNQVLTAIKKAGIGRVPYKAVVTETNKYWLPVDLLKELKQEHEQMTTGNANQLPDYLHKQ